MVVKVRFDRSLGTSNSTMTQFPMGYEEGRRQNGETKSVRKSESAKICIEGRTALRTCFYICQVCRLPGTVHVGSNVSHPTVLCVQRANAS